MNINERIGCYLLVGHGQEVIKLDSTEGELTEGALLFKFSRVNSGLRV